MATTSQAFVIISTDNQQLTQNRGRSGMTEGMLIMQHTATDLVLQVGYCDQRYLQTLDFAIATRLSYVSLS